MLFPSSTQSILSPLLQCPPYPNRMSAADVRCSAVRIQSWFRSLHTRRIIIHNTRCSFMQLAMELDAGQSGLLYMLNSSSCPGVAIPPQRARKRQQTINKLLKGYNTVRKRDDIRVNSYDRITCALCCRQLSWRHSTTLCSPSIGCGPIDQTVSKKTECRSEKNRTTASPLNPPAAPCCSNSQLHQEPGDTTNPGAIDRHEDYIGSVSCTVDDISVDYGTGARRMGADDPGDSPLLAADKPTRRSLTAVTRSESIQNASGPGTSDMSGATKEELQQEIEWIQAAIIGRKQYLKEFKMRVTGSTASP